MATVKEAFEAGSDMLLLSSDHYAILSSLSINTIFSCNTSLTQGMFRDGHRTVVIEVTG